MNDRDLIAIMAAILRSTNNGATSHEAAVEGARQIYLTAQCLIDSDLSSHTHRRALREAGSDSVRIPGAEK